MSGVFPALAHHSLVAKDASPHEAHASSPYSERGEVLELSLLTAHFALVGQAKPRSLVTRHYGLRFALCGTAVKPVIVVIVD